MSVSMSASYLMLELDLYLSSLILALSKKQTLFNLRNFLDSTHRGSGRRKSFSRVQGQRPGGESEGRPETGDLLHNKNKNRIRDVKCQWLKWSLRLWIIWKIQNNQVIYPPIDIRPTLRLCEILDSTFFFYFWTPVHTFPFGLHILVGLHSQIILCMQSKALR